MQPAAVVHELLVRERGLRVVVAPLEQRVARQPLEVPPVLLDVLAVVALRPGEAEHPLLEDRVVAVPEREREAELVADVRDAGHAVLVPAVRARAGVVVREGVPGVAALGVVLAHRAPGALAQVRAPLVPRVRGEEVVLGAARRLGEARVLGGLVGRSASAISPPGVECGQVEEVPGPRVERDVEPVAQVVAAPLVDRRRPRRRRAASSGRAGRPTAARRGRPRARRRGSRRRACAASSSRQPQTTRFCQVSLPSQPRARRAATRRCGRRGRGARRAAARRRRAGRRRAPRRAGGRGRPGSCTVAAPRAGPRARAARRSGSASSTAAARAFPGANVAAARGSSWFSMKRTSRCW